MTRPFTLTVAPSGHVVEVEADVSLLEAALRAGLSLPSSCRNGTCRACICRSLAGDVGYRIEWPGLTAEEKAQGWILPCVAVARSDVTIVQPDAKPVAAAPGSVRSRGF